MKTFNNFNAFALTNTQVQEVNGGWCSGGSYGGRTYSRSYSYDSYYGNSCDCCYGCCGGCCDYQQAEVEVKEQPRTTQSISYSCEDLLSAFSSCFNFCGGW